MFLGPLYRLYPRAKTSWFAPAAPVTAEIRESQHLYPQQDLNLRPDR